MWYKISGEKLDYYINRYYLYGIEEQKNKAMKVYNMKTTDGNCEMTTQMTLADVRKQINSLEDVSIRVCDFRPAYEKVQDAIFELKELANKIAGFPVYRI